MTPRCLCARMRAASNGWEAGSLPQNLTGTRHDAAAAVGLWWLRPSRCSAAAAPLMPQGATSVRGAQPNMARNQQWLRKHPTRGDVIMTRQNRLEPQTLCRSGFLPVRLGRNAHGQGVDVRSWPSPARLPAAQVPRFGACHAVLKAHADARDFDLQPWSFHNLRANGRRVNCSQSHHVRLR